MVFKYEGLEEAFGCVLDGGTSLWQSVFHISTC